jgi:hypothetical protein
MDIIPPVQLLPTAVHRMRVREQPAALRIAARDIKHQLAPLPDDDLRRPDLDLGGVGRVEHDGEDVAACVVPVGDRGHAGDVRLGGVDGAHREAQPAFDDGDGLAGRAGVESCACFSIWRIQGRGRLTLGVGGIEVADGDKDVDISRLRIL